MKGAVVLALLGAGFIVVAGCGLLPAEARRSPDDHLTGAGLVGVALGMALAGYAGFRIVRSSSARRAAQHAGAPAQAPAASPDEPCSEPATDAGHACPGCGAAMAATPVREVTLYLCSVCGGTWADGEAFHHLAARGPPLEPLEGFTERRCAYCRITLSCALLDSTPVERCTACGGVYLDHDELEFLAPDLELPQRPQAPGGPPARMGFDCVRCGGNFPFAEGNGSSRGLMCRSCVALPGTTAVERTEANVGGAPWGTQPGFLLNGMEWAFYELVTDAWRTLRSRRDVDARGDRPAPRGRRERGPSGSA